MVEEDKKGFVEDKEIVITEVELKVNRNNEDQVDKVIFHSNNGIITWKPKITKETYEGGFKVVKQIPMERDMLPKKLIEIAIISSEQKECKVIACYNWWETEAEGGKVIYRFMTSTKTFDKWEIIKEEVKEEQIAP